MASVNRELGFLTELLVSGDYATVTDNHIGLKFLNGANRKAYKYIRDHASKYGRVPSIHVFQKKFPSVKLVKDEDGSFNTEEPIQFWCDELREKYKHNIMVDALEETYEHMDKKETEDAYKILVNLVSQVENEISISGKAEVNKDTKKRKEAYLKRQKGGGLTGLPSGIDHWDRITGGSNDGELTCIMGFTGIGKSWFIIIIAVYLAKMGFKPVIFTTEMHYDLVMRRIDAVWCSLNYTKFVKGQLDKKQQKAYFDYLDKVEGDEEHNVIVEQVTNVEQIGAKIDINKPDVVFVDGAYLLADEDDDQNWLATVKVFRSLHRMCLNKHVPILATTQSKDEAGASLKSLQFAKAIAQDCDIVGVLEQDEQMKNDKEVRLKPLKLREASLLNSVYLNWDFDAMNYSSIYSEEIKEEPKKEEAKGVISID